MDQDLAHITKKASIEIIDEENLLIVKSKFYIFNKSNFGTILWFIISLFMVIVSYKNRNDWIFLILGLFSLVIFTMVR